VQVPSQLAQLHYDIFYLVIAGLVGIVWKIVWDWLKARKENGHLSRMEFDIGEMADRQKKMWEAIVRIEGKLR
jgi:hypothetical protein